MLQVFVCAVAITATSLAAAVSERNRSEAGLVELTGTLEHRVADRTAELAKANTDLARSNQELDDFAYIASHDLKEPLRGISNYSNFLVEDYGDKLGEAVLLTSPVGEAASKPKPKFVPWPIGSTNNEVGATRALRTGSPTDPRRFTGSTEEVKYENNSTSDSGNCASAG